MKLNRTIWTSLIILIFAATLATGCASKSPEEKVADLRARYNAELNGFVVKNVPLPVAEEPMEGEEAEGSDEATGGDEGIDEETLDLGPQMRDVILDVVIHHDATEMLPGITLEVSHGGPDQQEKGHHRIWVDTSRIARGQHAQVNHVLEGIEYAEGDGFHVEIRHPVPVGERSEYREFSP